MKLKKNTPYVCQFTINDESFIVASIFTGTSIELKDTTLYVFTKKSDSTQEYYRTEEQVRADKAIMDKNSRKQDVTIEV